MKRGWKIGLTIYTAAFIVARTEHNRRVESTFRRLTDDSVR